MLELFDAVGCASYLGMTQTRRAFQSEIKKVAKPWVDAYSGLDDQDFLVRSLLKGIEHRIAEQRGVLPHDQRCPGWCGNYDRSAFSQGRILADELPMKKMTYSGS